MGLGCGAWSSWVVPALRQGDVSVWGGARQVMGGVILPGEWWLCVSGALAQLTSPGSGGSGRPLGADCTGRQGQEQVKLDGQWVCPDIAGALCSSWEMYSTLGRSLWGVGHGAKPPASAYL